jgi:uncharacterized membrane protein
MVLAHAGDWLVDSIFVAPVVVAVVWVSIKSIVERRREAAEADTSKENAP